MNTTEIYTACKNQSNDLRITKMLLLPEKVQLKPRASISILAHEARNPLTSINLAIGILQSEIENDSLKMYLEIIADNSVRISEMMNQIIQLKEISSIKNHPEIYC
jgi:signal transduction histidine kinase